MGSCVCLKKLEDLLRSLIPVLNLKLNLPLIVPKLAEISQVMAPRPTYADSLVRADIDWAFSLPPCPIHISLIAALKMNLALMAKLEVMLGESIRTQQSISQFRATIRSLHLNFSPMFPMLKITPLELKALLDLSSLMAQASNFRNSFSVDLFGPTPLLSLRLALQARLAIPPIPIPPLALQLTAQVVENVNAWAALSEVMATYNWSLFDLLPKLSLIADLQLPTISLKLFDELSTVVAVQQTSMQLNTMLSLNPLAVNLRLVLPPLFEPLQLVETLQLPPAAPAPANTWPYISAQARASIDTTVAMNLRAMLRIPIPNLAPLQLAVK